MPPLQAAAARALTCGSCRTSADSPRPSPRRSSHGYPAFSPPRCRELRRFSPKRCECLQPRGGNGEHESIQRAGFLAR